MPTDSNARDSEEAANPAATFVIEQLAQRTRRHIGDLNKLARALHTAGRQLEGNLTSPYFESAATHVENFAELLQADPKEIVTTLRRVAQTRPALFLGGAVLTGFGGARFFKSSTQPATATHAASSTHASSTQPSAAKSNGRSTAHRKSAAKITPEPQTTKDS